MPASKESAQTSKTKKTNEPKFPARIVIETFGNQLVDVFILVALFVLGATVVWSAVFAYLIMIEKSHATIEDILLLFIYLELGAMIGIMGIFDHHPMLKFRMPCWFRPVLRN